VLPRDVTSERLLLRPLRLTDLDALVQYQSNPSVVRYLPWPVRDREAVDKALAVAATRTRFAAEGDYLALAIELRATGDVIGQMNAMYRSELEQHAEVGFVLNPRFGGLGYATEATRLLVDAILTTGAIRRITMRIDARHERSIALAERLAFQHEQDSRVVEESKGELAEILTYTMRADDWPEHS